MLSLINDARKTGRNCGTTFKPSVPPVSWDCRIEDAAILYSIDMDDNDNLSHTGSDGSNPGDRLTEQGYDWSTWGEIIAFGTSTPQETVNLWLGSAGHCAIIMGSQFEDVGCGESDLFWTCDFATEK